MAKVLLLTNTLGASAEVLPALGLLQHQVKILPAEASVLVDAPDVDLVLIDARRDLPTVKSLTKLLHSTGVGCPIIAGVINPLSDLTTTLPRERLCQNPNPVAKASTIAIGSKDFTGVVCLNGEGSATYEHSWR